MRPLHLLPSVVILALLGALLPSTAIEVHGVSTHLSVAGFDHKTVYLAGHDSADKTLHIEPVSGTAAKHCLGCLLREQQLGGAAARQLARKRIVVVSVASRAPEGPRSGLESSSRIPRAPPIV